jgi:hypothetical protein
MMQSLKPNGHDQRARPEVLETSEVSVGRAPLHWVLCPLRDG